MFRMQPNEKKAVLQCTDAQQMTPLHCAAMFDYPDVVEYLISEGADINALDHEWRSPLLLGASRGAWKTVLSLIRLGAQISIKDVNSRNVLHLVIMNGGRLDEFAREVARTQYSSQLQHLLNEKDSSGCSALHYASREGHIRSLENLIRLGACINLKNNNNESALHFAARYGRYNTVKQLLDSEKGTFIINGRYYQFISYKFIIFIYLYYLLLESDGEGLTPLHISSQQGHTVRDCLFTFWSCGFCILLKTNCGANYSKCCIRENHTPVLKFHEYFVFFSSRHMDICDCKR